MPSFHRIMEFPFPLGPREAYIQCVSDTLKRTKGITRRILACVVCITYHSSSKRVMKQMLGAKVNSVSAMVQQCMPWM